MPENKALVAICNGHAQVERAIAELLRLGFHAKNLSVFRKAHLDEEEFVGLYTAGERLLARGGSAAFWERMWDLLGDGGFFLVPRIGPVVLAGPFIHTLVAAVDDGVAVGGLSALGAAIYSLGIPRVRVLSHKIGIMAGQCAVVALASPELVTKAKTALLAIHGVTECHHTAADVTETEERGERRRGPGGRS
jgi:hypothetical protein